MGIAELSMLAAGLIGGATSVSHAVQMHRNVIVPIDREAAKAANIHPAIRRLAKALLQFTTFNWLMCSFMLVISSLCFGAQAKTIVATMAAASFAYGGISLFWAVRRVHPGWMLMLAACVLIAVSLANI